MKTSLFAGVALLSIFLPGASGEGGPIFDSLKGDLVKSTGTRLAKYDASALSEVEYYGIYYSASWCPPCRQFTPDLVRWYNRIKKTNPQFELIFVSSDETEADMAGYMKEDKMKWPALDFAKKRSNRVLTKYSGSGIPCLVLVDRSGKVLSDSYVNGKYVGPRKVMEDIGKTLEENPPSKAALAAAAEVSSRTDSTAAGGGSFDDFFKKK